MKIEFLHHFISWLQIIESMELYWYYKLTDILSINDWQSFSHPDHLQNRVCKIIVFSFILHYILILIHSPTTRAVKKTILIAFLKADYGIIKMWAKLNNLALLFGLQWVQRCNHKAFQFIKSVNTAGFWPQWVLWQLLTSARPMSTLTILVYCNGLKPPLKALHPLLEKTHSPELMLFGLSVFRTNLVQPPLACITLTRFG